MPDESGRARVLLVALVAGGVRLHVLGELAARVAGVHRMAGRARDALAGRARAEAFRAREPLVFVRRETGRSVRPEARREAERTDPVVARDGPVERGEILAGVVRVALREDGADALGRLGQPLAVAVPAHHRGAVGVEPVGIRDGERRTGVAREVPAVARQEREAALGVRARRPVAGAACDAELGDLRVPRPAVPVVAGLRLHVVAENAIRVPLRDVLRVRAAVRMEERPVEVHPPALNEVVGDGQADPSAAVLREVLLDAPRADGAHDLEALVLSGSREAHEVAPALPRHLGADASVVERAVLLEIAEDGVGRGFARHRAVERRAPRRVLVLVTLPAVARGEVARVRPARVDARVVRRQRPEGERDSREDESGPAQRHRSAGRNLRDSHSVGAV